MQNKSVGFGDAGGTDIDPAKMKSTVTEAAKKLFRPEFLNRVDEMLIFKPLGKKELLKIVDIMMADVISRTTDCGVRLSVSDEARQLLLDKGYDPRYGARPLRRAIQKMVEDSLANLLLENSLSKGDAVVVNAFNGELKFDKQ